MKNKLSVLTILVMGAIMIAFTQSRTITGKVADSSGQPLSGVSVIIKGSITGTTTDRQGSYKIEAQPHG